MTKTRTVGGKESEQERGRKPLDDHTTMDEVCAWWRRSGAASSVMAASGKREINKDICEQVVKSSVLAHASPQIIPRVCVHFAWLWWGVVTSGVVAMAWLRWWSG